MSTHERRRDPAPPSRGPFSRHRRRSERATVDLQARIADSPTIVDLRDLTPDGVSFDSPIPVETGARVVLLTRICNAEGVRRDIALPVVTRWTRPGHRIHHVGAEFAGVDGAARALLAEYCTLVASSPGRHAAV